MGYDTAQVRDLERTIDATECDLVLIATPIDLRRLIKVRHPTDRVRYELQVISQPTLEEIITQRITRRVSRSRIMQGQTEFCTQSGDEQCQSCSGPTLRPRQT